MSPLDNNFFLKRPIHLYRLFRYRVLMWVDSIRGIDLTRAVSVEELHLDKNDSRMYYASSPTLKKVLRRLKIKSCDSIIDIGCGKGRAMYYMSKYSFKEIAGVEISSELSEIAVENFRKLGLLQCRVYNIDATQFTEYDKYNYIFFYNPFSDKILEQCMINIENSLQKNPRKVVIIYHNPVYTEVIQKYSFNLIRTYHFNRFHIYENK